MRISAAAIVFLTGALAWGQNATKSPAFEVAAIRTSEPGLREGNFHTAPGVFSIHNITLRNCMEWAFGIRPLQLSGPAWLNDVRFDIEAHAADRTADDDQIRLMVQTLLAERFGMKMHRDQKEQSVFRLTVAKGGPKLHPAGGKDGSKFVVSTGEGSSEFSEDKTGAIATRVTMYETANKVSNLVNRIVIDETGLQGRYDFRLDLRPFMTPDAGGKDGMAMDMMSILFEGFNQQLGLKLEPGKEVVELVVIDSINKIPTDN